MNQLKIFKMDPRATMPVKAHATDAGADLAACLPMGIDAILIAPGDRADIPLQLKFGIPDGFELQIRPRSGLAFKHGITIVNAPGTIDAGYVGEVRVPLANLGKEMFAVRTGDRIAQMIFAVVAPVEYKEALDESELHTGARGAGGFGSTGIN